LADHSNAQLVQFTHQFQAYWTQRSPEVLLERLANAPFLTNIAGQELQDILHGLVQLMNQMSVEIIRSFQHIALQGIHSDEQRTASELTTVETSSGLSAPEATPLAPQPSHIPAVPNDSLAPPIGSLVPTFHDPAPPIGPPHPAVSMVDLIDNVARAVGIDTTWVTQFAASDGLDGFSSSYFPDAMVNTSGLDSQRLAFSSEQGDLHRAEGNVAELPASEPPVAEPPVSEPRVSPEQTATDQDAEDDWDWML
jgi:hypothetical protein